MDAAQAPKSSGSDAHTFEVGQLDATVVADHHVLDVALPIDKSADLPACFV
jgi:hypothetical protein